tara:strand:- start:1279 stop:1713 length:435 start_codon:yes stop_codon:yes gene_type:complete
MFDPEWFNTRKPDLGAIEREWSVRFSAAEKYEMRPYGDDPDEIQFDETKITDANDLEFLQHAFKLLKYHGALGDKGNDVEETAQLKLGGYFPPPPPDSWKGDWLGDGIILSYEHDGIGQENAYEWFLWCGPCQSYQPANDPCCY